MKRNSRREEGQSLIIVGALLIVLFVLVGLVVDAGNAYAQRRIVQNAVDAAALAGSQALVHQEDYLVGGSFLYNWQVIAAAEEYAERNGVDPEELDIHYTNINGQILADAKFDLGRMDIINQDTFGGVKPEGLQVAAQHPFDTYLIRLLGRNEMEASAKALGILACGACSAGDGEGLFPIAVDNGLFEASDGLPVLGFEYRIWGDKTGPGSFGYLSWNTQGGHTSEPTLAGNMADTSLSGLWKVGDLIPCGPGVKNSSSVEQELKYRIDDRADLTPPRPKYVTLPIFDVTEGNGENLEYHVVGFGRFEIQCYHFSKTHKYGACDFDSGDNSKWIQGKYIQWLEPSGEAGCTNFGVCTAKLRPPLEEKRALVGNVVPWRLFPEPEQMCSGGDRPVDLVHVMDISGSMCAHWDGSSHKSPPCTNGERIQTAKNVITEFNEGLDWDAANQVGLATYPKKQGSSSYTTDCYTEIKKMGGPCNGSSSSDCFKSDSTLYLATKDQPLTTNITTVNTKINGLTANGGTSMALGLQYGREMVTDGACHKPDNLQVLILTTDGMPNVKIDGHASGYLGNYPRPYWIIQSGCNESVYDDVVEQANLAKQQGVIVFAIGIHTTIDEDLMRAIASQDSDPSQPHFFQATSGVDFQTIYEQIQERLPTLCSEECNIRENAGLGSGATVRLYDSGGNLVGTTTADASGHFIFSDLEPGTYELRASWQDREYGLLYDVMTLLLGGDPLDPGEKILVVVPEGTGTTHRDVYLRTSQQIDCD